MVCSWKARGGLLAQMAISTTTTLWKLMMKSSWEIHRVLASWLTATWLAGKKEGNKGGRALALNKNRPALRTREKKEFTCSN